jgi:adenylate cyclase
MKKWIISFIVIILLCGIKFTNPWFLDVIRLKGLDSHQRQQEAIIIDNIVTIEINNDTLAKYGQWPFPRGELADIVYNIYKAGANLVVLPMLFAEPDRHGQDTLFENMLLTTPTIIGQIPGDVTKGNPISRGVSAVGASWEGWLYRYPGAVGPLKSFADAALGVGMLIVSPEDDGVVRRVPLAVDIDGKVYPSMSMEIIRALSGDLSYQIKTGAAGVEALRIPKYGITKTDANGNIWIDFKYKTKVYPLYEELPDLSGKIVILTVTASGLGSVLATPVGNIYGYDLLATSITTMMSDRNISIPYWGNIVELVGPFILSLIICIVVLKLRWLFGAILLPIMLGGIYYSSLQLFVKQGFLVDWTYPILTIFIVWAVSAFLRFMDEFKLRQQIKKQFEHYLAPAMVKKLQQSPDLLKLGGNTKELTLLFCDIRGFTPISEQYKTNPQGLTKLINRFLTPMTDIIMRNGGTVDKYMGDCIMAFWNAPLDVEDQRKRAIQTSHEMLEHLEILNKELKNEKSLPIKVGIGLNTGEVVVGNMGSNQRFDYSVLGDAVNLAARLEGQSKNYGVQIVLGEETAKNMDKDFAMIELDEIAVKGKQDAVKIYTSLGQYKIINHSMNWVFAHNQHEKFLTLYRQQSWVLALKFVSDLRDEFNGMLTNYYDIMKERIIELKETDLPKDWDGVYRATTK